MAGTQYDHRVGARRAGAGHEVQGSGAIGIDGEGAREGDALEEPPAFDRGVEDSVGQRALPVEAEDADGRDVAAGKLRLVANIGRKHPAAGQHAVRTTLGLVASKGRGGDQKAKYGQITQGFHGKLLGFGTAVSRRRKLSSRQALWRPKARRISREDFAKSHGGLISVGMSIPQREPTGYRVGDLSIDLGTRQVSRAGQALFLPKLSYELLI